VLLAAFILLASLPILPGCMGLFKTGSPLLGRHQALRDG
jgi:hypothetical protein